MKNILQRLAYFSMLSVAIGLMASLVSARMQKDVLHQTELALKAGDSQSLTQFFDSVVELKTDSKEGAYSKTQAEFVLKDFFRRYPPSGFEFKHKGSSPAGAYYAIGTYTSSQATFRVYIKMRQANGKHLMDTLSFTKD